MVNIINILNQVNINDFKFYSPLFGDVKFDKIEGNTIVVIKGDNKFAFNDYGQFNYCDITSPECLLQIKGKTWEELQKSMFKSGDFLVSEFNDYASFNERRGIKEYDWIYINDIDRNEFLHYGPGSVKDLSEIDMDKYHLLKDDEEYEFYKSFVFTHIFDNPSNPELFDDMILHLLRNESVRISSIDFNEGGFDIKIEFNGRETTYRIDMSEYQM